MVATLTIGLAHDTGTSASDHITSDATLTGTTDAGAAVAVYDLTGFILGSSPPVLLATVTADASGTWSYTPSVPDGPHAFMVEATDVAGNVRDSSPFYMTLDTAPPTIRLFDDTGASASDHITANPILTGTAAPGTVVTLMEGTTVLGTATADATGRWGFLSPTIGEGSHTITANTAGGSSSLTFTLDHSLVTPTIGLAHDTGTSASDHITSDATLTGTTDAGAAVAVYDLTGFILGSSPPVLLATVTADASGTWSYTPSVPDGPHAFMAHATDVAGNVRDSSPFYMTLDTAPPVAANDSYSTAEDTPLVIAAAGVMTNDTDVDSQRLTASLVAGPAHGTLTLDANGGFTYAPVHNYNGTDSFTYKVNDGTADSNIATVALTVTAVNDAPMANSDINGVVVGKTVRADAAHGVLANDADPDGDALHVSAVDGVAANVGSAVAGEYGSLILKADGSYSYSARPNSGSQVVQDTFTYTANDGSASSTGTLTITVAPRGLEYLPGTPGQPLNGTAAGEVLDASLGNQVVNAGGGNDILLAGDGDTLTGGSGHDTFAFFNFGSGSVTITDFQPFTDHLQFDPGVTVTSVTTGASGLDLHLSSGGDIIFQTPFPLPDWHLVL